MLRRNYIKKSQTEKDIADTQSSSLALPQVSDPQFKIPISDVEMLKTMKAEAELRKWRVNPKTLAITPPVIRRNYAKECLTDGALQFKIPIYGIKLLQTKMAEANKKIKRRPSKKKKAPTLSPSPPQPFRTEVRYMMPEVEKEKVVKKKENKTQAIKGEDAKKKENRPKANREFKISVSEFSHFFNMSDYPDPVMDKSACLSLPP